jgi:hypothetical protein
LTIVVTNTPQADTVDETLVGAGDGDLLRWVLAKSGRTRPCGVA